MSHPINPADGDERSRSGDVNSGAIATPLNQVDRVDDTDIL